MKKAIALLATLAVVATTAFAQLAPSITGHAETKWGTNLNDETNGFELDTEVTVTVPFVTAETVATEDGEGATGTAEIEGSSLTFTFGLDEFDDDGFFNNALNDNDGSVATGTDASISAKIKFLNGAYATIGSESDIATNFVASPRDVLDVNPTYGEEQGISLGYEANGIAVEFTIANEIEGYLQNDKDPSEEVTETYHTALDGDLVKEESIVDVEGKDNGTNPAAEDGYIIGFTAGYTADMFAAKVAFGTNATADKDTSGEDINKNSFAFEGKFTGVEGLTVTVPFDFVTDKIADETMQAFELMPSVDYAAGAVEAGLSFHYFSVNDKWAAYEGDTLAEIEMVAYSGTRLSVNGGYTLDAGKATLELGSALGEKAIDFDERDVLGDGSLLVTAGKVGEAKDMDLTVKAAWTADAYSATLDLGNVLHEDGMDDLGFDATYSGIAGMAASLETTISLDDERDNSEAFTVDALNVDLTSELTGVENTTFTVNFSEWDGSKEKKGIFYVGAKVAL